MVTGFQFPLILAYDLIAVSVAATLSSVYRAAVRVVHMAPVVAIHDVLYSFSKKVFLLFTLVSCHHNSDAEVIPGLMTAA